jgi:hypothetical protein
VYTLGDTLDEGGEYYLGALPVAYYGNESNARNDIAPIATSQSYQVATFGGSSYSNWNVAVSSTGSSTPGPFPTGYQLNPSGTYFLYPLYAPLDNTIYYFSSLSAAQALNPSGFLGQVEASYTVGDADVGSTGGYSNWYLGSNSTGTSLSGVPYQNGDVLNQSNTYYLGAIPVVYFNTSADAIANVSALAYYQSYTVDTVSGTRVWALAENSTGSSQEPAYTDGQTLNPDGAYFLYPAITPGTNTISFYSSLSAANTQDPSGFLGIQSAAQIIGGGIIGDIGAYAYWYISSVSSTGTSTSAGGEVYTSTVNLSDNGSYFLGAIPVAYFSNKTDALSSFAYPLSNSGYTVIGGLDDYPVWAIAENSTGSSLSSTIYVEGSVLNPSGAYFLYPAITASSAIVYFTSLSAADADVSSSTFLAVSDTSYAIGSGIDLGSTRGYSHWYISANSTGSSTSISDGQYITQYTNGQTLSEDGIYFLGGIPVAYFNTQADALADVSALLVSESYTVTTVSEYANWRIAANSTGTSSQSVFYASGNTLSNNGAYFLYPGVPCFLEGTTVLCKVDDVETYVPVEQLKPGTLVKTSLNGYKPVVLLGRDSIENPGHDERIEDRLYKLSPSKYPQLKDDLYITGGHSVLEFPMTEKQTQDTIKKLGDLYVTEGKYRLMACIDERADPWTSEGRYPIWAFALEHTDDMKNYGVYVNGGLLVESCSVHFLKKNSNMTLVH